MKTIHRHGTASATLDLIRFLAALAVLLGHAVSRYFGPYDSSGEQSLDELLFRAIFSGYGSHGVTVFFVLSGYFIGFTVLKNLMHSRFTWKSYVLRRIIRLWIVLIPGLVITYTLDYIGVTIFPDNMIYSKGEIFGSISQDSLSLTHLIGNLFFLQTIAVPTFGTNTALWSLANEFWYYILFPVFLFIIISKRIFKKLIYTLAFLLISAFIGKEIFILFAIWVFGVIIIFLPDASKLKRFHPIKTSLVIFILTLVAFRTMPLIEHQVFVRILVGLLFALSMVFILDSDREILKPSWYHNICRKLGGFSYTLYVLHIPLLGMGRSFFTQGDQFLDFDLIGYCIFFGSVLTIVLISYVFAVFTEFKTKRIYRFFKV